MQRISTVSRVLKLALVASLGLCACSGQNLASEDTGPVFKLELTSTVIQPGDPLRILITLLRPDFIAATNYRDEPVLIQVRFQALNNTSLAEFELHTPQGQIESLSELGNQKGVVRSAEDLSALDAGERIALFTSLLSMEDAGWVDLVPDFLDKPRLWGLGDRAGSPISVTVLFDNERRRAPFALPGVYHLRLVPSRGGEGLASNVEVVECRRPLTQGEKQARDELKRAIKAYFEALEPELPSSYISAIASSGIRPLGSSYFVSVVAMQEVMRLRSTNRTTMDMFFDDNAIGSQIVRMCAQDLPRLRAEILHGPCLLLATLDALVRGVDFRPYATELQGVVDAGQMTLPLADWADVLLDELKALQ